MNSTEAMYGAAPKRFQMPLCDRTVSTEVSSDYLLPDYQPEIRRVLRVSACPLLPAKYVGGGRAEFNGTVDYQLIYVGSDGEIYSAPFSAEYAFSVPLELSGEVDMGEGVLLLADTRDDNISVRVSAPRRLNVKCRLISRVRAYGMMIADEKASGEVDPMSIQRLDSEAEATVTLMGAGDASELYDEIPLSSENMRVIGAYADMAASEIMPAHGYADCKGEIALRLLVCRDTDSGSAEVLSRSIPFSERIEIDGLEEGADCRFRVCVSDMTVSVEEGKISCTLNVIPEVVAYVTVPVRYTKDIYSTENYCESAYREYLLPRISLLPTSNFSQSERIPLSELGIDAGSRVVELSCRPTVERIEREQNKYTIGGQCRYSILLESGGEYNISELTRPMRYEFSGDYGSPEQMSADMRVLSCRARTDGDNLGIDVEISVCAEICAGERITALSEVRFGERAQRPSGDIVICYPSSEDTVWSIAKRYFVPVSGISSPAGAVDSLDGVRYVLINS